MVWGVEGRNGTVREDLLSPLGLTSYGGGTKNGRQTYHVFNDDKSFDVEVYFDEIINIAKIYNDFKEDIRRKKLTKINGI